MTHGDKHAAPPPPEFSRIVRADRVVQGDTVVETIEAGAAERGALARRFELEAIDRLVATLRLTRVRGGTMVRVDGELEADVVQTCVVTLEPVRNRVHDRFDALFAPAELVPEEPDEIEFDLAALDEEFPEPMHNNRIDVGELTAQHLSLALDPFPRVPGAELPPELTGDSTAEDEGEPARPNPFAALERLKPRH